MDLIEFEAKEKAILESIKEKGLKAKETGLIPGVPENESQIGYLIYLRYPKEVNAQVEEFSKEISDLVTGKAIIYGKQNTHQTIADYEVHNIKETNKFIPDEEKLEKLTKTTKQTFEKFNATKVKRNMLPWTIFGNYISSPDSVLLTPLENIGNYGLIQLVSEEATKQELEIRKAWGRHITVNRFTEEITPENASSFYNFMYNKFGPIKSFPNASNDGDLYRAETLNLGYFIANKKGFELTALETFEF